MNTAASTEKIVNDLKVVAHDAEELIRATASEVSERARDARAQLTIALETAKQTCQRWEEKARDGATATGKVVHQHPYQSIGVAFAIGLLLGVLVKGK